jgi:hypothetical protein
MLTTCPTETDSLEVVNALAYDWVFGTGSEQAAPNAKRGSAKRRKRKYAETHTALATKFFVSGQTKILKTQSLEGVRFSTDLKAQRWLNFGALVLQWRAERGATSSITAMAMCEAYQKIIGMGPDAIPLILAQMRSEANEPDQWFWALQVLTGVDPVADEARGDFLKMSQSWMAWAENEGYEW